MLSYVSLFRSGVVALIALTSLQAEVNAGPIRLIVNPGLVESSSVKVIPVARRHYGGNWRGGGRNWNGGRHWNGGRNWAGRNWNHGRAYRHYRGHGRHWNNGWGGYGLGLGFGIPLGYYGGYYGGYYDTPIYRPRVYNRVYRGGSGSHVEWCYDRYRSYREWDNTFQPYHGPRRQCYSPY